MKLLCFGLLSGICLVVSAAPLKKHQSNGKFLHITDIHIDPTYKANTDPSALCHRALGQGNDTAGQYGTLGSDCDSPVSLVDASFGFMKTQFANEVDFIIYTGDTARHDRDTAQPRTGADVLSDHKTVISYFTKTFDLSRVKLIPTIGNNDDLVHDNTTLSDPIFPQLAKIWQPLGLNLENSTTFLNGGYFFVDVIPGKLRVLNLNSMYFFAKNPAMTDNCNDASSPGGAELAWLTSQLQAANDGKYKVIIMGHVPPADDKSKPTYFPTCQSAYVDLLGKFASSNVISGHMTGHTNDDTLSFITGTSSPYTITTIDKKNIDSLPTQDPVLVLTNAPSLIPVNNPAMREYTFDPSSGAFQDYTQYYTDLNSANNGSGVDFQVEYSFNDQYGTKDLSMSSLISVVKDIRNQKHDKRYLNYVTVQGPN